jgi:hypothetical protein
MRLWILLALLPLAGCFYSTSQPAPVVVVPPGSSVICPNGSPAVYDSGVYRC